MITKPTFATNNVTSKGITPTIDGSAMLAAVDKIGVDAKAYLTNMCDEIDTKNTALDGKDTTLTNAVAALSTRIDNLVPPFLGPLEKQRNANNGNLRFSAIYTAGLLDNTVILFRCDFDTTAAASQDVLIELQDAGGVDLQKRTSTGSLEAVTYGDLGSKFHYLVVRKPSTTVTSYELIGG